jgi:putative membrane protein
MPGFFIRWLLNAVALAVAASIVPGIHSASVAATLIAALVLGILNAIVRPFLLLLTLPINLLTLGLFTFVVNGIMLLMTGSLVRGFMVDGLGAAILGSLVLSFVSFLLNVFITDRGRVGYMHVEYRRL